jgi:DNA-directed RNA polymerase specialized sigma24 family protein
MDRQTFQFVVTRHQSATYRYLRYLGARPSLARDFTQKAFLAAERAEDPPDPTDDPATAAWVRAFARDLFFQYCRDVKRDPVRSEHAYHEQAEKFWAEHFLRGGDGLPYVTALNECLKSLTGAARRILELYYTERKPRDRIARKLGLDPREVREQLRRARSRLAECADHRLTGEAPK